MSCLFRRLYPAYQSVFLYPCLVRYLISTSKCLSQQRRGRLPSGSRQSSPKSVRSRRQPVRVPPRGLQTRTSSSYTSDLAPVCYIVDSYLTLSGSDQHLSPEIGCFTCRLRRKKCDEKHPSCGACVNLCVKCEYKRPIWWGNAEQRRIQKERIKNKIKQTKMHERNGALTGMYLLLRHDRFPSDRLSCCTQIPPLVLAAWLYLPQLLRNTNSVALPFQSSTISSLHTFPPRP